MRCHYIRKIQNQSRKSDFHVIRNNEKMPVTIFMTAFLPCLTESHHRYDYGKSGKIQSKPRDSDLEALNKVAVEN